MMKALFSRLVESSLPLRKFEVARWAGPPTLSVVADDGYLEDAADVAPLLESFQVRGTFAICHGLLAKPGYVDTSSVKKLIAAGHEIASHMVDHVPSTRFSNKECLHAMLESKLRLMAMGAEVKTLVYPYGVNDRRTRKLAAQHYDQALGTWPGVTNCQFNAYAIRRMPFGSYEARRHPISNSPEPWLDHVVQHSSLLTVMLHSGAAGRAKDHTKRLTRLLDMAKNRRIHIRTVNDALREGRAQARQTIQQA